MTASGVADEQAHWFLAGMLLLRLAEQLNRPAAGPGHPTGQEGRPDDRDQAGGPWPAIVIAVPGEQAGPEQSAFPAGPALPARGAEWFGGLLGDLRLAGADIVVAPAGEGALPASAPPGEGPPGEGAPGVGVAAPGTASAAGALLAGRRSAACGERCRRRPCSGYEVHAAGLLAAEPGQAWLRLWAQALVLAFLAGRPVPGCRPRCPRAARRSAARSRECLLATVIEVAVGARASALRPCYDPRRLTAVVATVAGRMLADGEAVPVRAGSVWVIPQLRWLHEMERLSPLGRDRLRPDDIAPPLDFGLAGLPDWPGMRVADRLGGLRGHPLAMESERNRTAAMTALLGDGRADLDADLAIAGMGISPPRRLRHAARAMGAAGHGEQPGWLEVVLSWPQRLIGAAAPDPGHGPDRDRIASGRDEH